MSILVRRAIILSVGVLIVLISLAPYLGVPALYWPFTGLYSGGLLLMSGADKLIPVGAPGQNLNTSDREIFKSLSTVGLALAASLSIVYCFWERRVKSKAITFSYFLFLIVLLSMSTANFAALDALLNRSAQALIDLVLVVLGLITTSVLIGIRPTSPSGAVIRAVVVFLLVLQGIALPAIYGLLWFLNWQNAVSLSQSRSLNPAWISAVAGAASAVTAVLNYRNSKKSDPAQQEKHRVILR